MTTLISANKPIDFVLPKIETKGINLQHKIVTTIIGILGTPFSMLHGIIGVCYYITKLAISIFKSCHGAQEAAKGLAVSALRIVPLIGMQLAEHYSRTGKLLNFIESPALVSILNNLGLNLHHIVFNRNGRIEMNVLTKLIDTRAKACKASVKHMTIQTPSGREHAASFIKAKDNTDSSPVVILSHGNAACRGDAIYEFFLNRGYNILLVDYSGDSSTKDEICSEKNMLEDAAADIDFVCKTLNVNKVAFAGISLGGAHAVNHAYLLAQKHLEGITVPFIMVDQSFTSTPDVVGKVVEMKTQSTFLKRIVKEIARGEVVLAKATEPDADGLNTKEKLALLGKQPEFKECQVILIGTKDDEIMGNGEKNLMYRLAKAAKRSFDEAKVHELMIEWVLNTESKDGDVHFSAATHCSPSVNRIKTDGVLIYKQESMTVQGKTEEILNTIIA
jgi:hypothetical protein